MRRRVDRQPVHQRLVVVRAIYILQKVCDCEWPVVEELNECGRASTARKKDVVVELHKRNGSSGGRISREQGARKRHDGKYLPTGRKNDGTRMRRAGQ